MKLLKTFIIVILFGLLANYGHTQPVTRNTDNTIFTGINRFSAPLGVETVHGTDGTAGADVTVRAGDGTSGLGGFLKLQAGTSDSGVQGSLQIVDSWNGTATLNGVVCSAGVSSTVADCAAGAIVGIVGVAQTTTTPVRVVTRGGALILSDNVAVVGDNFCMSLTDAAKGHSNGSAICPPGTVLGIVRSITELTSLGQATTTLPLVSFGIVSQGQAGSAGNRAVTGTPDTILENDNGKWIIYNSASSIAASLPCPSATAFGRGWMTFVKSVNSGIVTITATGGCFIDTAALTTIVLPTGFGAVIESDGTNFYSHRTFGAGTSGGIPYFSALDVVESSGVLGAGEIVLGGGAGAAPTSTPTIGAAEIDETDNYTWTGTNVQDAGTKFSLRDSTDVTKRAQFDLSGITSGTDRTYALLDQDGTVELQSNRNTGNGYLGLDAGGQFALSHIPDAFVTSSTSAPTGGSDGLSDYHLWTHRNGSATEVYACPGIGANCVKTHANSAGYSLYQGNTGSAIPANGGETEETVATGGFQTKRFNRTAAFTNQPANDGVELISDDAGDTQDATIYGTTNGTDQVVVETVTLTGVSQVSTTKTDWGSIKAIELDSAAVGTITIREASGNATITTITVGNTKAANLDTLFIFPPSPTDDVVLVGNGELYEAKTIPDCTDTGGNHLNYTQSTNAFSCGTSSSTASAVLMAAGSGNGFACSAPGTTEYAGFWTVSDSTTEANHTGPVPRAGTIKNLYVLFDNIPASQTVVVTIRKNGADTSLTCSATTATDVCNDTSNSFTVVAGDLIAVKGVCSGGTSDATQMTLSVEFTN